MSLISLQFLVFTAIAVTGYYLIPKKYQWQWLLGFSYVYYLSAGVKLVAFLLFSTATTYLASGRMKALERGEADKKKARSRKRGVLVLTLVLNFWHAGSSEIYKLCDQQYQCGLSHRLSAYESAFAAWDFLLYVSVNGISAGRVLGKM